MKNNTSTKSEFEGNIIDKCPSLFTLTEKILIFSENINSIQWRPIHFRHVKKLILKDKRLYLL